MVGMKPGWRVVAALRTNERAVSARQTYFNMVAVILMSQEVPLASHYRSVFWTFIVLGAVAACILLAMPNENCAIVWLCLLPQLGVVVWASYRCLRPAGGMHPGETVFSRCVAVFALMTGVTMPCALILAILGFTWIEYRSVALPIMYSARAIGLVMFVVLLARVIRRARLPLFLLHMLNMTAAYAVAVVMSIPILFGAAKLPSISPFTPEGLLKAAREGDLRAAELALWSGVDPDTIERWGWYDSPGYSVLALAASNGHDGIVSLLLQYGAKVDGPTGTSTSPLVAAAQSRKSATVLILLEHGANPHSGSGSTHGSALHAAAVNNDVPLMDTLLKAGIPIDTTDQSRRTPLHYAAGAGKPQAVQFLLERGADRNSKDSHRFTPLVVAQNRIDSELRKSTNVPKEPNNQKALPNPKGHPDKKDKNVANSRVASTTRLSAYEEVCRLLRQSSEKSGD